MEGFIRAKASLDIANNIAYRQRDDFIHIFRREKTYKIDAVAELHAQMTCERDKLDTLKLKIAAKRRLHRDFGRKQFRITDNFP